MKDIHTLLKLLRFASFQDYVLPDTLLSDNIDWRAVYALALHQGISAIVLDGIGRLPKEIRPSKPILLQWIGQATMMEQMYAKHRGIISSLASVFAKDGIRMLLLKGYGCSLCYKKPEHRPTGDIDVYLFGRQDEADILVEKQLGIKVHREYHKHSTFNYGGVEVENHAKFIDDVSHKSNIRFESILMSVLDKEECLPSPIDNVLLPSPTFNALFLLRHTGEHFASNEITLRHVLDVGTFFRQYHSHIDWPLVFKVYKEERMLRFFNAIATICVEYLGLKAADIVVMSSHFEGLSLSSIEGMSSGRPFIASDVDGLHEIVAGNGLLFPHEDAKALADLILQMATDVDARNRVIDACQKKASQYDIKVMAEKYNNLYKL